MKAEQWKILKKCANMEDTGSVPVGLIVDSPWMPAYCGMSTLDFFTLPEEWLEAYARIKQDLPEIIFLPDYWVEYGMATEPSGFGVKVNFYEYKTPGVNHIIPSADDMEEYISELKAPNPKTDGLMPLALTFYKHVHDILKAQGESIKIVAARGPLTIASHLMGVSEFLVGLKIDPDNTHKLLKITSDLTRNWLEAQMEALSEVEGVLVLDDIVGFLSEEDYLEFAHPYFKDIFSKYPSMLHLYHNDNDNNAYYSHLEDMGVNIFNFTHKKDIASVRKLTGDRVCLLGNVPPLDVLAMSTPDAVRTETLACLDRYAARNGGTKGLILSAGGGASPSTPKENFRAMIDAVAEFNKKRV
jgi:uroporphyrinogen decarboxylase